MTSSSSFSSDKFVFIFGSAVPSLRIGSLLRSVFVRPTSRDVYEERGSILFSFECVCHEASLIFQIYLERHIVILNTCIYDAFGRRVCVCVCVCLSARTIT